jgi:hypothetical protein
MEMGGVTVHCQLMGLFVAVEVTLVWVLEQRGTLAMVKLAMLLLITM